MMKFLIQIKSVLLKEVKHILLGMITDTIQKVQVILIGQVIIFLKSDLALLLFFFEHNLVNYEIELQRFVKKSVCLSTTYLKIDGNEKTTHSITLFAYDWAGAE